MAFFLLRFDQTTRIVAQEFLRRLTFSDIARRALHADGHAIVIDQATTDFNGNSISVLGDYFRFIKGFSSMLELFIELFEHGLELIGNYNLRESLSQNFFSRVTGKFLSGAISRRVSTLEIVDVDCVASIFK